MARHRMCSSLENVFTRLSKSASRAKNSGEQSIEFLSKHDPDQAR